MNRKTHLTIFCSIFLLVLSLGFSQIAFSQKQIDTSSTTLRTPTDRTTSSSSLVMPSQVITDTSDISIDRMNYLECKQAATEETKITPDTEIRIGFVASLRAHPQYCSLTLEDVDGNLTLIKVPWELCDPVLASVGKSTIKVLSSKDQNNKLEAQIIDILYKHSCTKYFFK